jgi:hypothetical protein
MKPHARTTPSSRSRREEQRQYEHVKEAAQKEGRYGKRAAEVRRPRRPEAARPDWAPEGSVSAQLSSSRSGSAFFDLSGAAP